MRARVPLVLPQASFFGLRKSFALTQTMRRTGLWPCPSNCWAWLAECAEAPVLSRRALSSKTTCCFARAPTGSPSAYEHSRPSGPPDPEPGPPAWHGIIIRGRFRLPAVLANFVEVCVNTRRDRRAPYTRAILSYLYRTYKQ